jgi:adenylate kinase family enzyme
MQRVVVVGTSGSGKTTVAARMAEKLGLYHIELDSIHWLPNWSELPDEKFRAQVIEETMKDGWVVDGNYKVVRDILWNKADTIVWLDLPFRIVFWRIVKRTIHRIWTGERLWNDNVERLSALFGWYGMPIWVIRTYWRRKKEYSILLSEQEYSHLTVVHLHTVEETEKWLDGLKTS